MSLGILHLRLILRGEAEGVEVCDVDCELDGLNEFGRVKSGRMKLWTRLVAVTVILAEETGWNELYGTRWAVQVGESDDAPF